MDVPAAAEIKSVPRILVCWIVSFEPDGTVIEYKPLPIDDPKVRQPDITRAKKVLNWQPRVEFDEGIKKTIDYFKESLNG